ncbi:hypothetical protein [Metabacillus iocasae]|uniref:Uncharacterized protein n=1 Tax=Priestia iocasae TaxID=2291674 RepID=A0ABS2QX75_9BACI|nr:hypothetical protein [Metabacillus iocasae]MBM7703557.1 hypothetical protein [Metabacillus iocasae]
MKHKREATPRYLITIMRHLRTYCPFKFLCSSLFTLYVCQNFNAYWDYCSFHRHWDVCKRDFSLEGKGKEITLKQEMYYAKQAVQGVEHVEKTHSFTICLFKWL